MSSKLAKEGEILKRNIFGVMIDDVNAKKLIGEISGRLRENRRTVIFTPNPIMTQNARRDSRFMNILNSSDYNIPDGNGIILASRLLKTPISERICGIELAEELLYTASKQGLNVFLFGGKAGVADLAAAKLCAKYRGLKICGTLNGYTSDNDRILEKIKKSRPDILYVCLGSPKQEKWIYENADNLPHVRLFMGLGGSLDVWSGNTKRAPRYLRKKGFEWLWRMTLSPKKLKDLPKLLAFGFSAVAKRISSVGIMHR